MSRNLLLLIFAVFAVGCDASIGSVPPSDEVCPTSSVSTYGCGRVVALVDGPDPLTWPKGSRIDIRAVPARVGSGQGEYASRLPWLVSAQIDITAGQNPVYPVGSDTLSMWIVARIIDDPRPILPGVKLNLFAVDSAIKVVTYVKQNHRLRTDTIRLSMKKSSP
jgi:hypothetical protein